MKNKVIVDILERLMWEIITYRTALMTTSRPYSVIRNKSTVDNDYLTYVKGVIEGLKQDNTTFDIPNSSIDPNDWIIYTNTEFDERLTENEAVKNIKDAIKHEDEHEAIMEYIDKKFDKLAKKFIKVWE